MGIIRVMMTTNGLLRNFLKSRLKIATAPRIIAVDPRVQVLPHDFRHHPVFYR